MTLNSIEAVSVSKIYYRSRTQALSDITLTIGRGEIFTLLGRNGAGKTTFLRIAATQLMPSKGRISVLGHDVRDEPLQIRSKIAVVPQEGSTIGPLTPWDHVYLTLLARGMSRNQAHERSEKTIERLELTEYRNQPADSLSGGVKERVRVAIVGSTFSEEELSNYGRVVKLAERFRVLTDDRLGRELADEALKRGSDVGLARVSLEDLFVDLVGRAEE